MGILEIVKAEIDNTEIILYKEGIFLRAYEHSAYLFVNQIKEYSITKKYYKNAKQEVVYIGFPQNSFSSIENICNEKKLTIQKNNNQISISGIESFIHTDFENWKCGVKLANSQNQLPSNQIIEKIRSFPVISKSPIECQQFLIEIQSKING